MIDPMANLDEGGAPGAPTDQEDSKDVFDPIVLNLNLKRVDNVRSFMGIISGCFAGICGFTGLEGLGMWLLVCKFILCWLVCKCCIGWLVG